MLEMPMLERMIHMKPGIVFAGIVPNPLVSVHVGSLRVSGSVGKMALRRSGVPIRPRRGGVTNGRGAAARRLAGLEVRLFTAPLFLGEPWDANGQNENRKKGDGSFHIILILSQGRQVRQ